MTPTLLKGALAVGLALAVLLAERQFHLSAYLEPTRIQSWLEAWGAFAPVLFILLLATAVVVSPIPSLPLDVAAGAAFGPLLGTLYAVIGGTIGAIASFGIARFVGRDLIERLIGGHINFCRDCSDHLLTRVVLVSRLVPVISFDLVSYGAGLTKMSLGRFGVATAAGMIPLTFVYTAFGAVIAPNRILAASLGVALVVLFFLVPSWIERYDFLGLRKLFDHGD